MLAGAATVSVARIGKDLAESLAVADGDLVTVSTERGARWHAAGRDRRPGGSGWCGCRPTRRARRVRRSLGVTAGAVVTLTAGAPGPILAEGVDAMNVRCLAAHAQDPTLQTFENDVWWIVADQAARRCSSLLLLLTLFTINYERKVVARMAVRPGPNQVGPKGWLQSLTDGIKLPVQEENMPKTADKVVYFKDGCR